MEDKFETDELTTEEIILGWHYCYSFDRNLIGPGNPKMDFCKCKVNKIFHEQLSKTFKNDKRQTR